jgi:uncharacterized protein YbjT (DUF2867 family)
VAFVDCRSIGEAGARILLEGPGRHGGKAYKLTGPKAYTMDEAAALFTDILGRKIAYVVRAGRRRALTLTLPQGSY